MIADAAYENRYIQIGYTEDEVTGASYPESPWFFYEWSGDERFYSWRNLDDLPADGSSHDYKITSDSTNFYFQFDGNGHGQVGKWTAGSWSPNQVLALGEQTFSGSQSPGRTSNHVTIGQVTYKRPDGTWAVFSGYPYSTLSSSMNDCGYGDSIFTIWDSRY